MNAKDFILVSKFDVSGEIASLEPFGSGHINQTKHLVMKTEDGEMHYVLQRINKNVFKEPAKLMQNYYGVTHYLRKVIRKEGGDPDRESLHIIKTKDGRYFCQDDEGEFWRMLTFIDGSISYDKVETPKQFYDSAVAFGHFQYMLRDYPADTLYEVIPNFHNTPDRMKKLRESIKRDACGRAALVKAEIDFALAREEFADTLERAHREGKLPLRVTHNDTKLNNILFDKETLAPICVCDLDTIMPGYSVCDFGDSIRFGATTALEDEKDLSLVNFDLHLYEIYAKGFIEGAKGGLTDGELEMLPYGAIMMTFECGVRFLTDYLDGDVYFRIHRKGQNLDRARNQFKLVLDMERNLDKMKEIIKNLISK